ncbi:helix-turn-helix domain-containing protein [Joostella atrarenae]|uniref:Helix-turn-helix domain-containing protein n=1 Tax=Joostella atrarenae TaxID=679257 RepID=A0ABS9J751_9FLAO|nr:AraC family transcriptional regulator [Joostella atrarenae]MCF8716241.1 helix-turn-helix domain-containing protein [Joostella atrarenae]
MKPILESLQLGMEQTIIAFEYEEDNFETPWHFHPQHELTYIESSYGTKFIGDFAGAYEPGELVLIRSNVPHCWKNILDPNSKSKSYVIQWDDIAFKNIPELNNVSEMLYKASKGILFDKKNSLDIIQEIKKLPTKKGSDLYLGLLTILNRLTTIPQKEICNTNFTKDISVVHTSRMNKVHEFIASSYNEKIYLKEVSKLVGLSEQAFSRFFNKMMGRSFFTFLTEYRIHIATRMLIHTEEPISQIAFSCGFESPPFFFRKFKELKNTSPGNYRKKYR